MDRIAERLALVERLQRQGYLHSPRVIDAFAKVPRERFLPAYVAQRAYEDAAIHIGHHQTISAPHMVAIMTEALEVEPGQRILEVGTGSGYQAAILAQLLGPNRNLASIERYGVFRDRAAAALASCGIDGVELVVGDGSLGYPARAPYDRILVTCAAPAVPPPLREQLARDAILVIPVGDQRSELMRIRRTDGREEQESLGPCAFVPLTGAYGHGGPAVTDAAQG